MMYTWCIHSLRSMYMGYMVIYGGFALFDGGMGQLKDEILTGGVC